MLEGVTVRIVSSNNNLSQERPTAISRRYDLNCMDNMQSYSLNGYRITKLNSIPFSFKVSALSEFDVRDLIRQGLLDDSTKCIDGIVEREFNKTPLRAVGSAAATIVITTNSTATAVNTSALNSYHTRRMVLELKKRNVPGYAKLGGDYVFICSHEAMESMQGSIESTVQYTTQGYEKILNGEVGRWSGVRFVEDGFASRFTYDSTARTATAKSWTGTYSLDAYLFGSPTVREAVVVPEEIRLKVVTDYGRSHGLAWYALLGFAIEWSDEGNARVIKWDSA